MTCCDKIVEFTLPYKTCICIIVYTYGITLIILAVCSGSGSVGVETKYVLNIVMLIMLLLMTVLFILWICCVLFSERHRHVLLESNNDSNHIYLCEQKVTNYSQSQSQSQSQSSNIEIDNVLIQDG